MVVRNPPVGRPKKKAEPMVAMAVKAPQDLVDRVDAVATALGLEVSSFLRMMIVARLPEYEQQAAVIDAANKSSKK